AATEVRGWRVGERSRVCRAGGRPYSAWPGRRRPSDETGRRWLETLDLGIRACPQSSDRQLVSIRTKSCTTSPEPLTSVNGALLDEAERVFPGILSVERPFAPRPDDNSSTRRIVDVLGKEAPQSFSALESPFQIPHGEVQGFRRRVRLPHRRDVED